MRCVLCATGLLAIAVLICPSISAPAGTLQQSLVTHLPFDGDLTETVGLLVAPQVIGQPRADDLGTLGSGALTFATYANPLDAPPSFAAINAVSLANDPRGELSFGVGTDFSVSFWVRITRITGKAPLIGNADTLHEGVGWQICTDPSGRLTWTYQEAGNDATPRSYASADHLVDLGKWHHVAVTFTRTGDAATYWDGQLLDTRAVVELDVDGNWVPGFLDSGLPVMLGQDGTGAFVSSNGSGLFEGQMDDLGIWQRAVSAEEVARIFVFAQHGIDVSGVADSTMPFVSSSIPADGDGNADPSGELRVVLSDSLTALVPSSVQVFLDDQPIAAKVLITEPGKYEVSYTPTHILAPKSSHYYTLQYIDNSAPPNVQVVNVFFVVGDYEDRILPPPLYLETFEGPPGAPLQEGDFPNGWSVENHSVERNPVFDLDDKSSDAYMDWAVITKERAVTLFGADRGIVRNWQVFNGKVIHSLIDGQFCYANSQGRFGSVYQILYSPDIDLSGQTNVFLVFNSIYAQNQDSMGGVEVSTDAGQTWQPVVYMMDGSPTGDIAYTPDGLVDAVTTLTRQQRDTARFIDPASGQPNDGHYGTYIGVTPEHYAELGPYISGRYDDDRVSGKRVEFFRIPVADNQPRVRLRFFHCGTDSWYFGIDNVGLYSLNLPAPELHVSEFGDRITLQWTQFGTLQAAPTIDGPWGDVNAVDGSFSFMTTGDAQFYRAR